MNPTVVEVGFRRECGCLGSANHLVSRANKVGSSVEGNQKGCFLFWEQGQAGGPPDPSRTHTFSGALNHRFLDFRELSQRLSCCRQESLGPVGISDATNSTLVL